MSNAAVAEPSNATRDQRFFGNLEALRGVAALSVVLIHCIGCFVTMKPVDMPAPVLDFFYAVNGRNAVVLFFVLSGFVLSELLSRSGVRPGAAVTFLIRRTFRILPLAYVMMAVSAAYLLFLSPQTDLSRFGHPWLLGGYYTPTPADVVSAVTFQDYGLNTVYWTLYVELLGSLLFVPLYWLTSRTPAAARVLILIALLIASYLGRDGSLFPQYFFCFALGILAYQLRDFVDARPAFARELQWAQPLAAGLGLFMVAYAHSTIASWISRGVATPLDAITVVWLQVVIEGFGAAVLVFGCSGSSLIVNVALGNRPLRFLGRISFSLYCTHLIILKAVFPVWVAVFGERLIAHPLLGPLLDIGFVVPAAVLLSTVTYSYVELPGIAAGRKISALLKRLLSNEAAVVPV